MNAIDSPSGDHVGCAMVPHTPTGEIVDACPVFTSNSQILPGSTSSETASEEPSGDQDNLPSHCSHPARSRLCPVVGSRIHRRLASRYASDEPSGDHDGWVVRFEPAMSTSLIGSVVARPLTASTVTTRAWA